MLSCVQFSSANHTQNVISSRNKRTLRHWFGAARTDHAVYGIARWHFRASFCAVKIKLAIRAKQNYQYIEVTVLQSRIS